VVVSIRERSGQKIGIIGVASKLGDQHSSSLLVAKEEEWGRERR
jgi:hypothetical protein